MYKIWIEKLKGYNSILISKKSALEIMQETYQKNNDRGIEYCSFEILLSEDTNGIIRKSLNRCGKYAYFVYKESKKA